MSSELLDKVRSTESLPSLPTVAIEVLKLTRKDDVTTNELAAVIQNDPGLTAKILKVVNSPLFGIPREISSLKQAIGMLGMRTVKVMALSFSLVETVSRAKCEGFDFSAYWRRSLTTAVGARLIGKSAAPAVAEEAFVAGLLADVGIVAAWRAAPAIYVQVYNSWREAGSSLSEAEGTVLGCSHATMSAELLRTWGLPATVCDAVQHHHGGEFEGLDGSSEKLAHVVSAAARIADLFESDLPSSELFNVKTASCEETGLTDAQLEEILTVMGKHVKDTASMLNVQVGDTVQYVELQQEAAIQLAKLSMQAEMDRVESMKRESAVREEATRLTEEKQAILEVASTDSLTRCANRAAFDKRLDEELRGARDRGEEFGLILMDVDHFKKVNDTHGHQAGDEVLRAVGQCLRDTVRARGFVARYGGEEFVVMLVGDAARQVRELAEEIRAAIESRDVKHGGKTLHVTASLGTTHLNGKATAASPAQLLEDADRKLYESKHAGRNRVS